MVSGRFLKEVPLISVRSPIIRPILTQKICRGLFAVAVALTILAPSWGTSQSSLLTPAEVSGVSMREIDGVRQMSNDFLRSPDGQPIPKSEDEDWLPEMSLGGGSGTTSSATPKNALPKTPMPVATNSPPSTAARTILSDELSDPTRLAARPLRTLGSEFLTSPSSTYDPGFIAEQTGNLPYQNGAISLSAPNVSSYGVSPYGGGDSTPAPLVYGNTPIDPNGLSLPGAMSPQAFDAGFAVGSTSSVPSPPSPMAPEFLSGPDTSDRFTPLSAPIPQPAIFTPGTLSTPSLEPPKLFNPEQCVIADILCSAGLEMPISRFNKLIKTKIGMKFSQQRLEEDKRALLQTKQYVDVIVSTSMVPNASDQVVVNFDFTPRRQIQYIKTIGNKKFSKTELLEELNMKRGETRLDPYDVENGRIRIIELYKSKSYAEPHVEILMGNRPSDLGVIYLVNEGQKQRVRNTEFVGNSITSSQHLKSLISTKPGFFYIIGGDFTRERLDEDITKLLEYYRNLGYFDCRIDREFEEGEGYTGLGKENGWVDVRFIIDEGPHYKIRNLSFAGNRILSTSELAEKLKVKSGDYFNFGEVERDRIKLATTYQDIGYVRVDVTPRQIFTDQDAVIDICFDIAENYRVRVKDIVIQYEGDESRTKASVVMNQLEFAPSQLLRGTQIRASENNLRRSGIFNDKPNEGPLPSIAIIPEDENLYLTESASRRTKEPVVASTPKRQPNGTAGKKIPPKTAVRETSVEKPNSPPTLDNNNGVPPSESVPNSGVTRGQMRQIPTGFSNTTTNGSANVASTGNSTAWNQSGYVSYQNTQPAPTSNPYADTSMYNNGASPSGVAPSASSIAPPILSPDAQNATGLFSGTASGAIDPNNPMKTATAPGFAGAGRDAVFPGTLEQQYLDPARLDPTNEPIRDATVIAKIMEGRTGMLQASVGVNSNYGLIGSVSYTERNFDMFKLPTSLWRTDGWKDAFRGGGQLFRVEAAPGTTMQRYSASWDIPYIFDTKYNFGLSGLYGDRFYEQWYETRAGGDLRVGRQWTPRFSTTVTGGLYNVKIYRPAVDFVPDLNEVIGNNGRYSIGLSAAYDTRNHPFMPSEGYVINGGVEQVLGSWSYLQASFDARCYFNLHQRADGSGRKVLGLRSAAGWTGDKTPIYDRFFGGGYANLRGFEYREVTPRYSGTNFGVGGNFEWYNSAEVLVPVSGGDEFQLAFFVDTGTVSPNLTNWDAYRVAPGFGLRIAIPMLGPAPLALDFAFPVIKGSGDREQIFSFSIVGSR